MRQAMAAAEVGDDVYIEDPTVSRLQDKAGALFGREAALFVPSGTMGNQIAIRLQTSPGQEVIVEQRGHVYNFELAAMAAISGVLARPVVSESGYLTWQQIEREIAPKVYYRAQSALVVLENTHNMAGGIIYPLEMFEEVCDCAHKAGLRVHLDGARIFNAAAETGLSVDILTRKCDTVMFCLSKGLGAPVGSMLVGSRDLIERARVVRKMLGGGMRQVGILAAAGLVALEKMTSRLKEDHENARLLAGCLKDLPGITISPAVVQTNILMIHTTGANCPAPEISRRLKEQNVWISALNNESLRAVTHMDISREDILTTVKAFRTVLGMCH
jgi:threonine aldolase